MATATPRVLEITPYYQALTSQTRMEWMRKHDAFKDVPYEKVNWLCGPQFKDPCYAAHRIDVDVDDWIVLVIPPRTESGKNEVVIIPVDEKVMVTLTYSKVETYETLKAYVENK